MLYVSAHNQINDQKAFVIHEEQKQQLPRQDPYCEDKSVVEFNSNKNDAKNLIDIEAINRKKMQLEGKLKLVQPEKVK